MSNKEVLFSSEDVEKMVLTEIRRILKAKQRPSVESICKALHKGKGLTQGMVITIVQNMLATGQIFDSKYRGKQSIRITGEDCSLLLDQTDSEGKISECQSNLPAEASRRENIDYQIKSFEVCESPESLHEFLKTMNTPEDSPNDFIKMKTTPQMKSRLEPSFKTTDFMAFLDIISKLTDDIQALNKTNDLLRKNYDTLMEENCQLKIENYKLKTNNSHQEQVTRDAGADLNKQKIFHTKPRREQLSCSGIQSHDKRAIIQHDVESTQISTEKEECITNNQKRAQELLEKQRQLCLKERQQKYEAMKVQQKAHHHITMNYRKFTSESTEIKDTQSEAEPEAKSSDGKWINTILIAGDSLISNIDQRTLSRRYNMRVRSFPGATTDDMFDYLKPLLKKAPEKILLVIGTNDLDRRKPEEVIEKLKELKSFIHASLPQCHIVISQIIMRKDKPEINMKGKKLNDMLPQVGCDILRQNTIQMEHLGRRGLHLNHKGNAQLAKNIISKVKSF